MECIFWKGAKDKAGYGVSWHNGKFTRAHRKAYQEFHNTELTAKDKVLHTCDNRSCVNPEHLYVGTPLQNSLDMVSRNRQAKGERCGNSKLDSETVIKIINDSRPSRVVAKEFNISKTNVLDIKNKKIWRHLWN